MSTRRGPAPDLRRLIVVAQAVAIHHFSMRRRPRSSEIGHILEHLLDGSGEWPGNRVNQLLEQAQAAGLVTRHEITPSLFEWSSSYEDIDIRRAVAYLMNRQE